MSDEKKLDNEPIEQCASPTKKRKLQQAEIVKRANQIQPETVTIAVDYRGRHVPRQGSLSDLPAYPRGPPKEK